MLARILWWSFCNTYEYWIIMSTHLKLIYQLYLKNFKKMWIAYWIGQLYTLYTDKTAKKKKSWWDRLVDPVHDINYRID